MKKMIRAAFVLCLLFALSGCGKKEATVVKTYAATDVLDVEKEMAAGREVTMVPYYEMSDRNLADRRWAFLQVPTGSERQDECGRERQYVYLFEQSGKHSLRSGMESERIEQQYGRLFR